MFDTHGMIKHETSGTHSQAIANHPQKQITLLLASAACYSLIRPSSRKSIHKIIKTNGAPVLVGYLCTLRIWLVYTYYNNIDLRFYRHPRFQHEKLALWAPFFSAHHICLIVRVGVVRIVRAWATKLRPLNPISSPASWSESHHQK